MTGVWNEGEMSPGGREMATSSGEREERRPGLMTISNPFYFIHADDCNDARLFTSA